MIVPLENLRERHKDKTILFYYLNTYRHMEELSFRDSKLLYVIPVMLENIQKIIKLSPLADNILLVSRSGYLYYVERMNLHSKFEITFPKRFHKVRSNWKLVYDNTSLYTDNDSITLAANIILYLKNKDIKLGKEHSCL